MALRQKYNFELSGLEYVKTPEVVTLNLSGTLRNVLERLLRNWNHVIVNSADAESGIAKVMILNSSFGSEVAKQPVEPTQGEVSSKPGATVNPLLGHF